MSGTERFWYHDESAAVVEDRLDPHLGDEGGHARQYVVRLQDVARSVNRIPEVAVRRGRTR